MDDDLHDSKWDDGIKTFSLDETSGIIEYCIIKKLNEDPTWKLCVDCEFLYDAKKRTIENIYFVDHKLDRCVVHC